MEFGLNEDQEAFRDTVRTFARGKLAPGYLERAKSERFPWDAHREVAALGVFGLLAGGEFSPLDHEDYVAAGLVVEELAYADFNLANAAIPVLLMSSLIARHGQDELRRDWLPGLVGGDTYVALGLTEPGAGSDVTAIRTTATATADGYVLRGEKTSVTMLAHAAAIIVVAQTVRDGEPAGVSAFLVPLDAPGIMKSPISDTGWRPLGRGVLHLDDVPEAARLLCYSALWHRTVNRKHTALAAMTKWYGPLHASQAIHDCLLLHGNFGYSSEYPLEQRMRDVLAVEIADGTAQIQKIIIARELYGRQFIPYGR